MDRMTLDQIDQELGAWLREERVTRAPERLVEDVFARTSRTAQVRRWPILRLPSSTAWLVSAAAVVLAVIVVTQLGTERGMVGTPSPTESPGPSRATPTPTPSPESTMLGTSSASSLFLGTDAAPIDVTEGFDSIWVANIHANQVRRYDPATMTELQRIPAQSAAWFGVTEDAVWVTHQTDVGVSRIDPDTNLVVANVGDVPPCAAPVLAFDSLWQSACDAGVILRIDPTSNAIQDRIPSEGHLWLAAAGGRLLAMGSAGLAALDPETGAFTPLPNDDVTDADFLTSDGQTAWASTPTHLVRIDPATGETLATLDYGAVHGMTFEDGTAWLTTADEGVVELDLETYGERRTIPVPGTGLLPFASGNTLWATDFNNSLLWRIDLQTP